MSGLKTDIEPGKSVIIGETVISCEYKKGGRTRLNIISPEKTRIVTNPDDKEIEDAVNAVLQSRQRLPT